MFVRAVKIVGGSLATKSLSYLRIWYVRFYESLCQKGGITNRHLDPRLKTSRYVSVNYAIRIFFIFIFIYSAKTITIK